MLRINSKSVVLFALLLTLICSNLSLVGSSEGCGNDVNFLIDDIVTASNLNYEGA